MHFEPERPRSDDERILPLINVVFLLLIFFMLAGRLAVTDPFRIEPPSSESRGAAESPEMTVHVGADRRLALDGEEMGETALSAAVAKRLAEDGTARLRLKADGAAEATRVVAIMELLREAGVETVKLLTVAEPR